MINKTKSFVDEYWFENLNLYPSIQDEIYKFLRKNKPELAEKYKQIYSKDSDYWDIEETKIKEFCNRNKISYKTYFIIKEEINKKPHTLATQNFFQKFCYALRAFTSPGASNQRLTGKLPAETSPNSPIGELLSIAYIRQNKLIPL